MKWLEKVTGGGLSVLAVLILLCLVFGTFLVAGRNTVESTDYLPGEQEAKMLLVESRTAGLVFRIYLIGRIQRPSPQHVYLDGCWLKAQVTNKGEGGTLVVPPVPKATFDLTVTKDGKSLCDFEWSAQIPHVESVILWPQETVVVDEISFFLFGHSTLPLTEGVDLEYCYNPQEGVSLQGKQRILLLPEWIKLPFYVRDNPWPQIVTLKPVRNFVPKDFGIEEK